MTSWPWPVLFKKQLLTELSLSSYSVKVNEAVNEDDVGEDGGVDFEIVDDDEDDVNDIDNVSRLFVFDSKKVMHVEVKSV